MEENRMKQLFIFSNPPGPTQFMALLSKKRDCVSACMPVICLSAYFSCARYIATDIKKCFPMIFPELESRTEHFSNMLLILDFITDSYLSTLSLFKWPICSPVWAKPQETRKFPYVCVCAHQTSLCVSVLKCNYSSPSQLYFFLCNIRFLSASILFPSHAGDLRSQAKCV